MLGITWSNPSQGLPIASCVMSQRHFLALSFCLSALLAGCGGGARIAAAPPPPSAPSGPGTDVLTYKNDLKRSGQNLSESTLTLANVGSSTFGLLRNLPVDGKVDAQPLYVSQLSVSG